MRFLLGGINYITSTSFGGLNVLRGQCTGFFMARRANYFGRFSFGGLPFVTIGQRGVVDTLCNAIGFARGGGLQLRLVVEFCGVTPVGITTFGTICGRFNNNGVNNGKSIVGVAGTGRYIFVQLIKLKI